MPPQQDGSLALLTEIRDLVREQTTIARQTGEAIQQEKRQSILAHRVRLILNVFIILSIAASAYVYYKTLVSIVLPQ